MKNQLAKAKRVYQKNATLFITTFALVDKQTVTITNLDVYYKFKHNWNVVGEGLIPFEKLDGAFNKLKSFDSITFTADGSVITSGKTTLRFSSEDINEFPKYKPRKTIHEGNICFDKDFKTAQIFTGKDELRPIMNGVYFDNEQIASTDAHRLFFKNHNQNINGEFIIPKAAFFLEGDFKYNYQEGGWLVLNNEEEEVIVRCIDGTYPRYRNVIPQDNPNVYEIDKKEFVNALSVLSLSENKYTRQIILSKDNLYAEDIDLGSSADYSLTTKRISGDYIRIGFNSVYMGSILKEINDDVITIECSTPNRAMIINNTFLLMPLQIK